MNDQTLTAWYGRFSSPAQAVLRFAIAATVGLFVLLCLFLAGRRIGGAFDQPLHALSILTLGILVAALAGGLRMIWHPLSESQRWARLGLPSVAVLLFCYALSLPGSSPAAVGLMWFVVVCAEGVWWLLEAAPRRSYRRSTSLGTGSAHADQVAQLAARQESTDEASDEITQQLTRIRDDQGQEMLFGQASAEFSDGERTQSIHLAFCPPLDAGPQISVMLAGGPDATVTVAQAESYGARFEVRLRTPADGAQQVMVEFEARCPRGA